LHGSEKWFIFSTFFIPVVKYLFFSEMEEKSLGVIIIIVYTKMTIK
jgi:hypothetical protein